MSWSLTLIGKPENVVAALEARSAKMEGQTKIEFDSALPHMAALVKENFGTDNPVVKLVANGYGYANGGEQVQRNLAISIERIYAELV